MSIKSDACFHVISNSFVRDTSRVHKTVQPSSDQNSDFSNLPHNSGAKHLVFRVEFGIIFQIKAEKSII